MQHEIHIEKMTFGGSGLGRIEGKACFVRFSAPGDVASVSIEKEKKSFTEASIKKLIVPSFNRVPPQCPKFGDCGGCSWQHIDYQRQTREKETIFREALWRSARVENDRFQPIVPAADPWKYRSRVQLKLHYAGNRLHIGFFRSGSHYVTEIPGECLISDERINTTIRELNTLLTDFPDPTRLPQVDIAIGESSGGTAIFHYIGDLYDEVRAFIVTISSRLTCITGTLIQAGRKKNLDLVSGTGTYSYGLPASDGFDFNLSVSSGGFSQVNFRQNRKLVEILCEIGRFSRNDRVLDLYCGNGNLSIPVAALAGEVVGIEDYEQSIVDARNNALTNNITNIEFLSLDAASGVRKTTGGGKTFDVVILDPPRTGASDVVDLIMDLAPSRIIYVSCDPMTLARDLGVMVNSGYAVEQSIPIDMFPHTYHVESITLLNKILGGK